MDPRRRPDDHLVEPLFAAFHHGETAKGRRGVALRRAVLLALTLLAIVFAWSILVGAHSAHATVAVSVR